MKMTIDLDEDLVREAMEILGIESDSRAVQVALEEFVHQQRRKHRLKSGLGNLDIELTPNELKLMEK